MRGRIFGVALPAFLAVYMPFCAPEVRPTIAPAAPVSTLWEPPVDLEQRDLFAGPWGARRAPDPRAAYSLIELKRSGVNPGLSVRDPEGRKWSVKQAPIDGAPGEGPIEVVVSRLLSAIGYHQPPVYFLPSFTVADDWGARPERGGRFRTSDKTLKDRGAWSWQQNPFVGTRPYRGLLVVLMMLGSSDLKNDNNTLYEYRKGDVVQHWYVVRDLGSALGTTGRFAPLRGDADAFARAKFVLGVRGGFVRFAYQGWHQELVRDRVTPDDVRWASGLLAQLSDRQWHDAFRAGGYPKPEAERFISTIKTRIAQGRAVGASEGR
jgi:hypothetical protein